jgi:two-component system, OmpR family, response regulator MprA
VSGTSILVVDDDAAICRVLARALTAEGYAVTMASDGGGALVELERRLPDLMVLDVSMPGLDGLAVARRARAKGVSLPILMLTARDDVADRVTGLDAGADDYLVKPFATDELLARIRALLRRGQDLSELVAFGGVTLDVVARSAERSGRSIALTARESELLALLLRNGARVTTREQALARVWGDEGAATANVVDRYVTNLRRKLGEPALIRTVRGRGFAVGE